MSKIISIGTAVPPFRHEQQQILKFMQQVYALNEVDKRKMKFMYHQSGIATRYSVLPDYSLAAADWQFYPGSENLEPFPDLELRMKWFQDMAPQLSLTAIEKCLDDTIDPRDITHLVTVSCTGLSAPGLDLQIMESLNLPANIFRTSINFMGCYAAIHALKLADLLCSAEPKARVLVVCTELCTLHFQKENTPDNFAASLLFGDGAAAVLVMHNNCNFEGITIKNFYSEVSLKGKNDMSWSLSSSGFLMQLSAYVPDLIEQDFQALLNNALDHAQVEKKDISHWCIHPGGKRILTAIEKSILISGVDLQYSYEVLKNYGNMSSPTILFVLKDILDSLEQDEAKKTNIFGAAFGPGLTLETFILSND